MASKEKFYITTAISYPNGAPHIGHGYEAIATDAIARFERLDGRDVFFLTGTDEHGLKMKQTAAQQDPPVTPRELADRNSARFRDMVAALGLSNDDFIRTTEPRHERVVQAILQDLYERDEVYRAEYDGWYCVTCERFYMEKDLQDGRCPAEGCGRAVEKITESNYFFRMSR